MHRNLVHIAGFVFSTTVAGATAQELLRECIHGFFFCLCVHLPLPVDLTVQRT